MLKSKIKVVMIAAFALLMSTSSALAAPEVEQVTTNERPEYVQEADAIIKNAKDQGEAISNLEDAGWELVNSSSPIAPLSASSCLAVSNSMMKQWDSSQGKYKYLIQVDWTFNSTLTGSCAFDSTSGNAEDAIALGVITNAGAAANVQAEYAWISTKDSHGNWVADGAVRDYPASGGATYSFEDEYRLPLVNYGDKGSAWFYIDKPTNSGATSYYIRSTYIHTWSTTTNTLNSVSLAFAPQWEVGLGWNSSTVVNSNRVSAQSLVTFN